MLPDIKYIGSWIQRTQTQTTILNIGCSIKMKKYWYACVPDQILKYPLPLSQPNIRHPSYPPQRYGPCNYEYPQPSEVHQHKLLYYLPTAYKKLLRHHSFMTYQRYRHLSPQESGYGSYNSCSFHPTSHLQLVSCLVV